MFLASLIDRALDGHSAITPRRASRYEADLGDAPDAPVAAVTPDPPKAAAPRATPPPAMAPARSEPSPITVRLEQLAPAPEAASPARPAIPAAPAASPPEPTAPAVREVHTLERIEVRHEPREIERRLERLTREHLIERVERAVQAPAMPGSAPATGLAAAPLRANPLRPRSAQVPPPVAPPGRRAALPNVLAAPPEPAAPTIVQVTIGRVEVRNTAPPPAQTPARAREPRVGLDDYLRRREQG